MARITVEDCLKKVNNRFTLIHMASKRVRQLRKGVEPSIASKNSDVVVSLREIAAGNVTIAERVDNDMLLKNQVDFPTEETGSDSDESTSEKSKVKGDEA